MPILIFVVNPPHRLLWYFDNNSIMQHVIQPYLNLNFIAPLRCGNIHHWITKNGFNGFIFSFTLPNWNIHPLLLICDHDENFLTFQPHHAIRLGQHTSSKNGKRFHQLLIFSEHFAYFSTCKKALSSFPFQ